MWMAEEMALFRQTVQALATAGYVFSRIDVNAWSTVAQGLQARDDDGTMITSIADRESQFRWCLVIVGGHFGAVSAGDVQCCYEAIITTI